MKAVWTAAVVAFSLTGILPVTAEDTDESSNVIAELERAKQRVVEQTNCTLRYKFTEGESLRWKVAHLATTETTIGGTTQTSRSRSISTKLWTVTDVDDAGNMTFTHSVENVDMWQQITDRPEVSYNSEKDASPPPEYEPVASSLGKPLTTVTIRPDGKVVDRGGSSATSKFGLGDIVMLLPPKPVHVGSTWYEPAEIRTRLRDGRVKVIKIRKLYSLENVATGVATISVKTEVLTPIDEASIKAQLVQQLTKGKIRFDVDAGRVLAKQMDWDETVVGFSGPDSMMKYLARFTEDQIEGTPAASTAEASDSQRR
jgi:hypothetical protein